MVASTAPRQWASCVTSATWAKASPLFRDDVHRVLGELEGAADHANFGAGAREQNRGGAADWLPLPPILARWVRLRLRQWQLCRSDH
jgi:hypothetical protein